VQAQAQAKQFSGSQYPGRAGVTIGLHVTVPGLAPIHHFLSILHVMSASNSWFALSHQTLNHPPDQHLPGFAECCKPIFINTYQVLHSDASHTRRYVSQPAAACVCCHDLQQQQWRQPSHSHLHCYPARM